MSETISSNVLFHFTGSLANIKSILARGFFPRYCPEYSLEPADRMRARERKPPLRAIPMVCFCDLPLSLIRKHLDEYGRFGIGLTKDWGLRNGVAPVIYTHPKGRTNQPIVELTRDALKANPGLAPANQRHLLAAYAKPFRGPAWRRQRVQRKVCFYDEREWRCVPPLGNGEPLFVNAEDRGDISKWNKRLERQFPLRIDPDDIQYLIVRYDRDEALVLELHRFLKSLYRHRPKDAVLVTTTIMTDDCIREDI